jgi:hypothetical protein
MATLRGPRGLGRASLALTLSRKLGLPPQCNVILVAAVCHHGLVTDHEKKKLSSDALTHGVGIGLAAAGGCSWSRTTGRHVGRGTAGVRGLAIARAVIVTGRTTSTPTTGSRLLPLRTCQYPCC